MNPKNALFLSASLTAFVLSVLFGVVTKVTNTATVAAAAPVAEVVTATNIPATEVPTEEILPSATVAGPLGPEEAAFLAAQALGSEDVYSVETFAYNGADSYKVVFGSGDIVYIGMDRQVLEMSKLPPVVVNVSAAEPTKAPKKHRNSGSSNNNQQPPAPEPTEDHGDDEHDD